MRHELQTTSGRPFREVHDPQLERAGLWTSLVTLRALAAQADLEGNAYLSAEALVGRSGLPIELVKFGLEALLQPDDAPLLPGGNGARVTRLETMGFHITHFQYYLDNT
jgi:hypothetical protein